MNRKNNARLFAVIAGVTVFFVFFWGVALRAPEILSGNYLFGFDHGRDYLAAYRIAVERKLTLIGAEVGAGSAGLSGLFHGPGYFYLITLMYLLFGGDPYGGLVLMFIFGVAALVLVYVLVRQTLGREAALTALFLTGVSPLIAPQSRFIWNHHLTSPIIVLVFYLVYRIPGRPRLFVPLSLFTAGLIYHFELAIAVPLVIAIYLSMPLIYRIRDHRIYLSGLGAAIMAFLPMLLFEMRHNFMAIRGMVTYLFSGSGERTGTPWPRVAGHFESYLANARNSFPIESGFLTVGQMNLLVLFLLLFLIAAAVKAANPKIRLFARFTLLSMVVSYGMFLLLDNTVWDYYLIHLHFVFILIFAAVIAWSVSNFRKLAPAKAVFIILAFCLLSFLRASFFRMDLNWRVDFPDYGGVEKVRGKRDVIDYVYRQAAGKPFNVMVFMAPIYTYPYEYLFKTYGKNKFGYEPGKDKKGDVYLIIERDSQDWYKGWLETVVVGGEVLNSEILPSGHLVEHRYFAPETEKL